MAEAIARVDAADAIDAFSAGLAPIGFIEELTRETLKKNGYGVEGLESKSLLPKVWEQLEWDHGRHGGDPPFDVVINMSGRAIGGVFQESCKVENWEIDDPYGEDLDVHQQVFEKIRHHVSELAKRCRDECFGVRAAERRSFARLHPSLPIFISLDGRYNAEVLNISEGGLALSSDMVLPNDPVHDMRVQFLRSPDCLEAPCQIAWRKESQKHAGIQFVGLTEDLRRRIQNWISAEASHGKQEQEDKICAEHNLGSEIPDAGQPANGAPESSTFGKPISKQHEARPFQPPRGTAAQTGIPSNKRACQPRSMLAGDLWNPPVLRRSWGKFTASGPRRRRGVILFVLIGLMAFTLRWLMIRHNAASEMVWAAKQTEMSSEAVKPVAPLPVRETPGALNPSTEKTQAQTSMVEPLPVKKTESGRDAAPKDSPKQAKTPKEPLLNRIVKTQSHSVKNAGTLGKPANEPSLAAFKVNVSPVARTKQTVPSPSQTRPRQEGSILPPADLVVPQASSDAGPDEAKSVETPKPLKQPVSPVKVTGAITILADPYLSLRIPDGDRSKKQRRGTSLQLGRLLSRVEPVYPEEAKQLGIQGTVKLHAIIGRNGSIGTLQPVNGPPMLVAAAVNAVQHWRYTETRLAGQSVETEEDIAIVFRLSSAAAPKE